jgi:hypothetical protein
VFKRIKIPNIGQNIRHKILLEFLAAVFYQIGRTDRRSDPTGATIPFHAINIFALSLQKIYIVDTFLQYECKKLHTSGIIICRGNFGKQTPQPQDKAYRKDRIRLSEHRQPYRPGHATPRQVADGIAGEMPNSFQKN